MLKASNSLSNYLWGHFPESIEVAILKIGHQPTTSLNFYFLFLSWANLMSTSIKFAEYNNKHQSEDISNNP